MAWWCVSTRQGGVVWRLQLRAAGWLGGGEAACTRGNWQMRDGDAGGALRVSAVRVRGRRGREREEVTARMDSRMHLRSIPN